MTRDVFMTVWPYLLVLTYLLCVVTLRVLGMRWRTQIDVHDRIRASRELRRQYLSDLSQREHPHG